MSFAVATDEVVTVERLRIRVRVHGEGRPLLLLNGLGAPLELWDPLVGRLAGVRAIAFDAPGSGRSEPPCLPLSIRGHARLAVGVLDALGHRRVDVLGLSFGGMVAQELARVATGCVDRLVLASTSCGWGGVPSTAAALSAVQTPSRYYSRLLFETVAPYYLGGRESTDRTFLGRQGRRRVESPPSTRGYLYQLIAAATWSSLHYLPRVAQPTLVLAGADDPLVPALNARILAGLLPRGRAVIVSRGGHLCLLDEAGRLAPLIDDFLQR